MTSFEHQSSVRLPRSVHDVFAFFADAYNLETLTPPWLRFHVLTPRPIEMSEGVKIDYRLHVHGMPIRWQSEITAWEPPHRFVDRQLRGPYRLWNHEHLFRDEDGATVAEDHVVYAVPGGALINRLLVARDVKKIFAYRSEKLRELFGPAD